MSSSTAIVERERLLQIAEEYRNKGYDVSFHPNAEDLPDFLKAYRPDLLVRKGDENAIVEVKSRRSLNSSSMQYLQNLAQSVEQHPGWRFELVVTNPEEDTYFPKAEGSLQQTEIETGLQEVKQISQKHPASAIVYLWSLIEATLRLVAEHEGLSLQNLDPPYLVKQLVTEGTISRSEYQLFMDVLSVRNAVAHGFKTTEITQKSIYESIDVVEQLLKTLSVNMP